MPNPATEGETPPPQPDQPPNIPTATTGETPAAESGEPFDRERAMRTIQQQREAEQALKKELAQLKAQVKAHDDASLSETERLRREAADATARATELETQLRAQRIESAVLTVAARLGIVDPEAAYRLLDLAAVELDAHERPTNVEPLLKDLLKAKPYLGAPTSSGNGAPRGNGPGPKASGPPDPQAEAVQRNYEALRQSGRYGRL